MAQKYFYIVGKQHRYLRDFCSVSLSFGDGERCDYDYCWNAIADDVELTQVEASYIDSLKKYRNWN